MIGYFVKAGDVDAGQHFLPYKNEYSNLINKNISGNDYGQGIEILLIEYHLEGQFLQIPEERYKVNSYRKKEQSISVTVYVPETFKLLSELEKRNFIISTTKDAVLLVKEKMAKKENININFDKLLSDLEKCSNNFIITGHI
ncbi:MAG: hypothetical protein HGA53_02905 [Anaerolineaceae bacterium]|nr:hypothetical protein [Anaerolineaceae bacterium]